MIAEATGVVGLRRHGRGLWLGTTLAWSLTWLAAGCSLESFDVPDEPKARVEALFTAVKHGSSSQVKALLDAGTDAGARDLLGWTPLHYAINRWHRPGYHETRPVKLLLDAKGIDIGSISNDGTTPARLAARHGSIEILDLLLARGANSGDRDDDGITLLMEALKYGHLDLAAHLIERGFDVNERLPGGGTALFVAIRSRNPLAVRMLIEAGAEVTGNEQTSEPIIFAAALGSEELISLLIEAGADVNAVNRVNGLTPLHRAVTSGPEMVRFLLDAGATPGVSSQDGFTPLDLAKEIEQQEIIRLLTNAAS